MKRLLLLSSAAAVLWTGSLIFDTQTQPAVSTDLALRALNGSATDAAAQRSFDCLRAALPWTFFATGAILLIAAIPKPRPRA